MDIKAKMGEILSDVKAITVPLFTLSPAKKIVKEDKERKKDEKMRTKFLEAWNNLRYDLGTQASLKKDVPIWILGICYHSKESVAVTASDDEDEDVPVFGSDLAKAVFTDFASRPWFTYRKQFPPLPGTDITSDTGWGCMLRSAQMMVAQGLIVHFLSREWRWLQRQTHHEKHVHRKILGWFIDHPGQHCPLSIHNLSEIGRRYGNIPGNWYGPNTVAYIMQQAIENAKEKVSELQEIVVYVAQDCTIYSEDVYDLCGWRNSTEESNDSDLVSNAEKDDSISTSSASSESEVYVDEIGSEASNASAFYIPQFSAEDFIPQPKIIDNMIPMTELVNSDSINPEVVLVDSWEYPEKSKVQSRTSHPKSSSKRRTKPPHESKADNRPKLLKTSSTNNNPNAVVDNLGLESKRENYEPHFRLNNPETATLDQKSFAEFQPSVSSAMVANPKMAHNDPESTFLHSQTNLQNASNSSPASNVVQNKVENSGREKIRLYSAPGDEIFAKNEDVSKNENTSHEAKELPAAKSKIREIFHDLTSKMDEIGSETADGSKVRDDPPQTSNLNKTETQDLIEMSSSIAAILMPSRMDGCKAQAVGPRSIEEEKNESRVFDLEQSQHPVNDDVNNIEEEHIKVKPFLEAPKSLQADPSNITSDENRNLDTKGPTWERPTDSVLKADDAYAPQQEHDSQKINTPSVQSLDRESERASKNVRKKSPLCHNRASSSKGLFILIPVRLGESTLNPIYIPCIEAMLTLESSIGIIGGKPKHSLYFVGFQNENLLHLDPHYCQVADNPNGYKKNLHEYHTMSVRKTNVKKIDPSCCFGFYCRTAEDFELFKTHGRQSFSPPQQPVNYPMCLIMEGRSGDHQIRSPLAPNSPIDTGFISKEISLPVSPGCHEDHKPRKFISPNSQEINPLGTRSPRKQKNATRFSIDEMGSKLNKLNPFPKIMRQRSSSPSTRRKYREEESLESQFELL